jgi:probable phosphoglycerate mutase
MIFYCVRHGESAFNAQGRIQGQLDTPLSDVGRRQSEAVAAALAGRPIEAVFASPLRRAYETARPLADALRVEIETDARLMEIDAGVFQGKSWPEIEASYPDDARRWMAGDPDFVIPQGESRRALMLRAEAALAEIRARSFRQVAVVAHGGVLSAAFKALLGISAERHPFSLFNASISQIAWKGEVKLVTLNQIDHLLPLGDAPALRGGDL